VRGCGEKVYEIYIIDYPRFFTPNGDGFNDIWNISGLPTDLNSKIYIFDRFGKLLKEISPSGYGWDGTFNGQQMPTNDYWFIVKYSDLITGELKEFRSHFTLKR
jgi:gliding motility-associated-like protein